MLLRLKKPSDLLITTSLSPDWSVLKTLTTAAGEASTPLKKWLESIAWPNQRDFLSISMGPGFGTPPWPRELNPENTLNGQTLYRSVFPKDWELLLAPWLQALNHL